MLSFEISSRLVAFYGVWGEHDGHVREWLRRKRRRIADAARKRRSRRKKRLASKRK